MRLFNLKYFTVLTALSGIFAVGCGSDDPEEMETEVTPVISSFSASPDKVAQGSMVTLTYAVSNAETVEITSSTGDAPLSASATLSGMVSTHAITSDTVFTLTAKNGSKSATQSVTVTVQAPEMVSVTSFSVSPVEINVGQTAALAWETANADSVSIATADGAVVVADGNRVSDTEMVMPGTTTEYVLTANGEGGPVTAKVTLTVNRPVPVIASFVVMPNAITLGDSATLSWNVMGATSIKLIAQTSTTTVYDGNEAMGMATVSPGANEVYKLVATNQYGTADQTVMVTVNDPPGASITSFVAMPDTVPTGRPAILSWDVSDAPDGITISIAGSSTTATTSASLTGQFTVTPTVTTDYTLRALNAQWGDSENTITVRVSTAAPEILSFSASPQPGPVDGEVTLSWEALGADRIRILRMAPDASEILDTAVLNGSAQVTLTSTGTWFTLEATNLYGGANFPLRVEAERKPGISDFSVQPQTFAQATVTATLTWDVVDATSIEIRDVNGMTIHTTTTATGTWSTVVSATTLFELVATSAGGTSTDVILTSQLAGETEPNDTSSTAIALAGDGSGAFGNVDSAGDQDWYAVTVSQAGSSVFALTSDGQGGCNLDTVIEFYDSMGNQLGTDDEGGPGSCSAFGPSTDAFARDLAVGTYYIKVRAWSGSATGSYVLLARVLLPECGNGYAEFNAGEQCDDGNTVDGDNCSATCTLPVDGSMQAPGANTTFSGSLDPAGDIDYYSVQMLAPGYIVAETFSPSAPTCDTDTTLSLLDETGASLAFDDNSGVDGCSKLDPRLSPVAGLRQPGTYLIAVAHRSGAAVNSYELVVNTIGQGCGNGIVEVAQPYSETCDDGNTMSGDGCDATCQFEGIGEIEPNDDRQNATFIASSTSAATSVIIRGAIDPTGDEDFYSFAVPEGYHAKIWVGVNSLDDCNPISAGGDGIRFRLYNDAGSLLNGGDSYSAFERGASASERFCGEYHPNIQTAVNAMSAGTYTVALNGYTANTPGSTATTQNNTTIGVYFLHLEIIPPECGNDIVDDGEQCDDGNFALGDGCDATCNFEILSTVTTTASVGIDLPNPSDYKIVRVDITTPGQSVTATAADGMGGCTVDTFINFANSDFQVLGSDSSDGPGDCAALHVPADEFATDLSTGTYYLVTINQGQTGGLTQLDVTVIDPACGNGIVERNQGETCDDQNAVSGDGCSDLCVKEPNGYYTAPSATATLADSISVAGERDLFEITVTQKSRLLASVFAPTAASASCSGEDLRLWLYAADGTTQLGFDDDDGPGFCPLFTPADSFTTLEAGTYFLEVGEYLDDDPVAAYELVIESTALEICGNGISGESYSVATGTTTTIVTETCDDGNNIAGDGCDASCQIEGSVESASSSPALFLTRGSPIQDVITFGTTSCVVDSIEVDMNMSHTWKSDVTITLTSPDGVAVTLHNRSGGSGSDIIGNYPNTLTVDGPGTLADFAGNTVQGDWVLDASDSGFGDDGTLNSWGIVVVCQ
ncbi:MAG: DUF4215 domain-containing protein [Myxococcota bacterium]|nr:DUF4215 domain-containing protein [Myxococcota bacterium]